MPMKSMAVKIASAVHRRRKRGADTKETEMIEWKGKPEEEKRQQEQEQKQAGDGLSQIDLQSFYELLMEQMETM